jgi:lipopolysaccharide transport system ATP-binding protein
MGRQEIMRKFDEIVAFAEIEKFLDTPVKYYSSGMYVRLAFAVAAHLEPEILVVDEVLAVGDVQFQKKCLGKMGDIAQEGRTVLFVSHNMAAIRKLCSKGILINQGKIISHGAIDQIVDQYLLDGVSEFSPNVSLARSNNDIGIGLEIKFFSCERVPQAQFKLYEPWLINLEFELYKPVPHMIAGVGMSTVDSIPLATYWSKPRDLPAGKYKIEFKVDLPLKACELQFTVGLSSHEKTFYYQERVGLVSISEIAASEQPIRSVGAGILLTPQTKDIEPLD